MEKWYEKLTLDQDVVISSRIRLARNFKKYPFPLKLSSEDAKKMIEETKEALIGRNTVLAQEFEYVDMGQKSPIDKIALMERHIVSPEFISRNKSNGLLFKKDESVSIMINEEDHLRLQSVAPGMRQQEAWKLADQIDNILEESIEFAFDEEHGYLTACPTNVGTGLRASYMLHLPALETSGQLQRILQTIGKLGITVRGIYGEGTEAQGSIYQISNQITLGQSEEDIMDNLNNVTNQIVEQERRLRERLMTEGALQLEDRIHRSYGILQNARVMTSKEGMSLLSDIKVGFELGILKAETTEMNIYELMMYCQPANLQKTLGREISSTQRDVARATFIREHLPININR